MKKIINKILALVFATIALSSCLKDDSTVLDPNKAGANLVDFVNPTDIAVHGSTTPLYIFSYPISTTPTVLPVTVSYSGAEDAAPKDITVNIGLATQAVIDQYNTEQVKTLNFMPATWYTLSATSVVIPKGKKTATFNITVRTDLIELSKSYVLPLKLASTDATVSSNFGTALFQIGAKNKFDGSYTYIGTYTASDRPAFLIGTEFTYGREVQLRSSGATSNNLWNSLFGDFLIPLVLASGGSSGLGQTNLLINFDAATNKVVSVQNAIAAPTNGRGMTIDLTAVGSNYFDPTSHDVFLTFFLTQPGFGPIKMVARLKYIGPRS